MNKKTVTVDWLIKEFGFAARAKKENSKIYGYVNILPKRIDYYNYEFYEGKIILLSDLFNIPELDGIDWKDSLRTREIAPDENTPKDTKVWVRNHINSSWVRGYLSGVIDGEFFCFYCGCTSWSEYRTKIWKYCKLAEEI